MITLMSLKSKMTKCEIQCKIQNVVRQRYTSFVRHLTRWILSASSKSTEVLNLLQYYNMSSAEIKTI